MPFPAKTDADAILNSAIQIVEQQGWEALSMRELGRKLGVRASSLYHHFRDRHQIEAALGERAAKVLHDEMIRAGGGSAGALLLRRLADAYLRFARSNPALYHLVAGVRSSSDVQPESRALWGLLLNAVGTWSGEPDDTGGAVALWAFLHGYAALEAAGKFGASGGAGGFERGLDALIAGLASKGHIL